MFSLVKRLFGSGRKPQQVRRRPTINGAAHAEYRPILRPKNPATADLLDNPDLSIDDTPTDDGFDPYNTGTFNRSGSWERINRRRNS